MLGVLRKILDKLMYVDLYPELEDNMSNSNIGGMRKKNIRNHLYVVYGIINAVIQGDSPCVDIEIFDLEKCFDVLWLEDVMNDLYDALPNSGCNDKLSLLYKSGCENNVSVKTAGGKTSRVNIPQIVMQGGSWGPIQCSNSIDSLGMDCEKNQKHLYWYRNQVTVPVLSIVDDMLAFSLCGQDSLSLNTYINTNIELKKLKFHTPDAKGKTKCHKLHVGGKNILCPDLKVHNTLMQPVLEDTYLGDIIRADGKNCSNIKSRASKGLGIIAQIMTVLETVSFGERYFSIALSFREANFINGILTNSDVWYHLTKNDLEELEMVDRLLLRKILSVPETTCKEAPYLETGCLDLETVIKGKRIIYLHYLVKEDKNSMLNKFFKVQWRRPSRGDWTLQVKQDLEDFGIPGTLEYLEGLSENALKSLVKKQSIEFALEKFLNMKSSHSKLDKITYNELKIQNYLKSSEIPTEESKVLMKWRLHMANFGGNYGQSEKKCPLCEEHLDNQEDCFKNCPVVAQKLGHSLKYEDIFIQPSSEIAKLLLKIQKLRECQAED